MASNPVAPPQPFILVEASQEIEFQRPTSAAVCPICSSELYTKRDELGALTHQNRRMELSLYHSSCITMMLVHAGALLKGTGSRTAKDYEISWGLSPVSRKPVDGFLRMPSLLDQRSWLDFVDWRNTGAVDIEDLAAVIAAILPINEQDSLAYINERFQVSENGCLTEGELSRQVLPHLERRCKELCTGKHKPLCEVTPFLEAVEGIRLLPCVSDWYALRNVSNRCVTVVQIILTRKLCCFLQEVVRLRDSLHRTNANVVTAALASLAPKGDVGVLVCFASLLENDNEDLQKLACDHLPRVMVRDDKLSFNIIAARLEHSSPQVRVAAIRVLMARACPHRSLQVFMSKVEDRDPSVRAAAIRALGEVAERGDQTVIREIVGQILPNSSAMISEPQEAAEDTLPLVAKGDEHTIELFCRELMHEDEEVCLQALRVLGLVAEVGDKRVIEALLAFCRPENSSLVNVFGSASQAAHCTSVKVKCAAIASLGKLAEKGDKFVLNKVAPPLLASSDPHILEAGVRLIGRTGTKKDGDSLRLLASIFSDGFAAQYSGPFYRLQSIRVIALEMIQQVGRGGHEQSTEIVMSLFKARDFDLRRRAIASLPVVAKQGDCRAIRALNDILNTETDVHIKHAAESALVAIGDPVYESNIRVCLQMCSCAIVAFACTIGLGMMLTGMYHMMHSIGVSFAGSLLLTFLAIIGFFMCVRFRARLFTDSAFQLFIA